MDGEWRVVIENHRAAGQHAHLDLARQPQRLLVALIVEKHLGHARPLDCHRNVCGDSSHERLVMSIEARGLDALDDGQNLSMRIDDWSAQAGAGIGEMARIIGIEDDSGLLRFYDRRGLLSDDAEQFIDIEFGAEGLRQIEQGVQRPRRLFGGQIAARRHSRARHVLLCGCGALYVSSRRDDTQGRI